MHWRWSGRDADGRAGLTRGRLPADARRGWPWLPAVWEAMGSMRSALRSQADGWARLRTLPARSRSLRRRKPVVLPAPTWLSMAVRIFIEGQFAALTGAATPLTVLLP